MGGHFEFGRVEPFSANPYLKPQILFHINVEAIWHGFEGIRYIKVNYG